MKEGIHPKYAKTTVTCVCGNTFETRTTLGKELKIEICSNCHPFFTGRQKLIDTAGRVERYLKKYGIEEGGAKPEAATKAETTEKAEKAEKAEKTPKAPKAEKTEMTPAAAKPPKAPKAPKPPKAEKPADQ